MKTPHSPEHICSGHAAIYDYGFLLLLFRSRLGQKLVQVELILRVTEVADHLTLRVFVPELYQLFAAKAEEHILRALLAAVALILHLAGIEDLRVEACHCQLHHILRGLACLEHLGDGRHGGDVLLQTGDLGIGRARQELQQIAALSTRTPSAHTVGICSL